MLKIERWGWGGGYVIEPITDIRDLALLAIHNDSYEKFARLARVYWDTTADRRGSEWADLILFWKADPGLVKLDVHRIFKHWAFTTGAYREVVDEYS